MDPVYLMSGNGRCSSANAVRGLGLQPLKHEWKTVSRFFNSLYSLKSCAGTPRYEWPLCVSVRRFPKEQVPGFSAIDCAIVPRSSSQRVIVATIDAEEKATQLAEEYSDKSDSSSLADLSGKYFGQPVDKTELEAIRANSTRAKLIRKLSEANQFNRHLKRQVYDKEQTLIKCKNELAIMEFELQALVGLAEEVARDGIKPGARKINGKYIHSHLALRLEELREKLHEQIKDVDAVQFREVPLVWYGMAEDVLVMGSFDGWIHGEQMSPESTGSFTKFSATLKLRPGRYEVKFLVDGEWQVSPELPTVGEGLMENNLLVVE